LDSGVSRVCLVIFREDIPFLLLSIEFGLFYFKGRACRSFYSFSGVLEGLGQRHCLKKKTGERSISRCGGSSITVDRYCWSIVSYIHLESELWSGD